MSESNSAARIYLDELESYGKEWWFDLGHPLLNRVSDSFVRAAGIGAIQAVSREAYFVAAESAGGDSTSQLPTEIKKHRFPDLRGANNRTSVEALVKSTGKESLQWGIAAGVYSGLTYGLKEARGVHDWKNSALAGAVTGAAVAMTTADRSHENMVQCAITGAAVSAAATLLRGIF